MHIGRASHFCPQLKIHGYNMERVQEDTYLGDIIRSDGKNCTNLEDRVGKGMGKITDIMNILETVSFGVFYFRIFVLLREAFYVNGTITNAEVWYGLKDDDLQELEALDRELTRRAFQCPVSIPAEACHLELGLVPIHCIVKERRLNYLHYLVTSDKDKLLYRFFLAQWENPCKSDWTKQTKVDLADLQIKEDLSFISSFSKLSFKKLVKLKIKEFSLDKLNEKKYTHSKMDDLLYTELEIQDYLLSEELSVAQKRVVFLYRTRMAKYSENYRGKDPPKPCRVCQLHVDCQAHGVVCPETLKHTKTLGKYEEIFSSNISRKTAAMLEEIENHRNKLNEEGSK